MEEVLSSRAKLRIMDAVSVRPRTLGELSDLAGISVQGVLRHLNRLRLLGLVEERSLARTAPKARRVYAVKSTRVRDFSTGGSIVVRASAGSLRAGKVKVHDLERASSDLLIQRRRIREEARRLGRIIDEAADAQDNLGSAINGLPLSPAERLILEVVLTEDTLEEGARVLARYYGLGDRRSIETALTKAKRLVGK
jgi:predicted transcriptional regulator